MELVDALVDGDRRALARGITLVENRAEGARQLVREAYPYIGSARVIGVTGPPGAGKSTLMSALTERLRKQEQTVSVLAVDPSSPFTGGALLGDRVRMSQRRADPALYFRSLAARGHLGGLTRAASDVIALMDAYGSDFILVETVGAGQSEVEIMKHVQTVAVVAVPGLGDEVQLIKAGILEIADVLVVNKADRPGADQLAAQLETVRGETQKDGHWHCPIVKTVAREDKGIAELIETFGSHYEFLVKNKRLAEQQYRQASARLGDLLVEHLQEVLSGSGEVAAELQRAASAVAQRKTDPYTAAARLWRLVRAGLE
jgi:LAO/AO transport system kinase